MSDYLNGLARRARLGSPYRKLLLLFLTDRADDRTGITSPASTSYIAFGLEISETTVKKYRKELSGLPGDENDVRLGLIDWSASSGSGGSAVYKIDVKALRTLADESLEVYNKLISREAPPPGREAPIDPARGDQSGGETSREAATKQSINLSNNHKEERDLFSATYAGDLETQKYAPDYFEHPAFLLYLEAFRYHRDKFLLYQRELFALHVELTEESLQAWSETLEFWKYSGNNPKYLHNLFDNYKRRRNGEFKQYETGATDRSGMARDTVPSTESGGGDPTIPQRRHPYGAKPPTSFKEWSRKAGYG